jgi:hypothetical protein
MLLLSLFKQPDFNFLRKGDGVRVKKREGGRKLGWVKYYFN